MAQQTAISKKETVKTAVEWFAEQAVKLLFDLKKNNDTFQLELCLHGLNELEEQAKQMEREQMHKCASFWRGKECEIEKPIFEQYYNETYGK